MKSWNPEPHPAASHRRVEERAGTIGRSGTFLMSSKRPPPGYRGKERGEGHQETAKDHGYLMKPTDGKRLPGPLYGGGAVLTLSLLVSMLAGGEVAEGGSVVPSKPAGWQTLSWARGTGWPLRGSAIGFRMNGPGKVPAGHHTTMGCGIPASGQRELCP